MRVHIKIPIDPNTCADLPNLEQTTFALVYFRQLIGSDALLKHAIEYFNKHSQSSMINQADKLMDEAPNMFDLRSHVPDNRTFLEAFFYGAKIIHKEPNKKNAQKLNGAYMGMYLDKKRVPLFMFDLHFLLLNILSIVSEAAVEIQRHLGHWINEGKAPKPNVFRLRNMFEYLPINKDKRKYE